ncbi:MAG: response regulator [Patescibacteria group bacterium]|nr:response regulator [Patescibacteria group bacterium]
MTKKIVVLLSDKDPVLRTVYKNKFGAEEGWEPIISGSPEEALQKIIKEKPAIIVTDIILDGGDGFELLENVRSNTNDSINKIPFVFLTELSQKEDKEKAKKIGITLYLVKSEISLNDAIIEIKKIVK